LFNVAAIGGKSPRKRHRRTPMALHLQFLCAMLTSDVSDSTDPKRLTARADFSSQAVRTST